MAEPYYHAGELLAASVLRSCGYCGGHHLGHNSGSMGGLYVCPRHLAAMWRGFDPQPGDIVSMIDGPQRDLLVRERDGDWLKVRRLGDAGSVVADDPGRLPWRVSVHTTWPGEGRAHEAIGRGLRSGGS